MKNYQQQLVRRTVQKFEKSQRFKERLLNYLEKYKPHLLKNKNKKQKIRECGNVLKFRKCLDTGYKELSSGGFCKYDRICIACATKRAIKMIKRFEEGIKVNGLYSKKWYYIVLTIKHSKDDSLDDLMIKLMEAKDKLARNYRNAKRDTQKNKSFFHYFDGMVISIEIAHKGSNGWHPHINILACSGYDIPIEKGKYYRGDTNEQLKQEWLKVTGDSYIHNIRKIDVKGNYFNRSGIGEVFKYAIKFSDLTIPQLADVMEVQNKKQYRFFSTYGIFRGWQLANVRKKGGNWHEGIFMFQSNKYYIKN